MTRTPWGESEDLKARRLPPGPSTPREQVLRIQRERILGAMVAAVEERGYGETRVADLVRISGVSRRDFYEHFLNLEECFLAAFDHLVAAAAKEITAAYRQPGAWDERLQAAFRRLIELVMEQPAAARMCLVEVYAVGQAGIARHTQLMRRCERIVRRAAAESPERAQLPPMVIRALVGGLMKVVRSRLRRREEQTLPELLPGLVRWALCYHTPPGKLPRRKLKPPAEDQPIRYQVRSQTERLHAAVAKAVAAKGYGKLTISDIVAGAGISWSTFYEHFATKEEAFLAAHREGTQQVFMAALPYFERAPDWETAVADGFWGLLSYIVAEPEWARLGIVETFGASARALEQLDQAIELFQGPLAPGFERRPDADPIFGEAIGGAIWSVFYDQLTRRGPETIGEVLSPVVFVALAPFVGDERAYAVASGSIPRG